MRFKLRNGDEVDLRGNLQAARFVYLAMPFQGLYFSENQEKPKIVFTEEVKSIIRVSERFRSRIIDHALKIDDFDDEIPF